jgi:hypothetical protein
VRFEDFWATATDTDADMLLIMSRMKSIGQCLDTRDCDRDEVFSRFPETIYQAIFFLRDYVFVNPKLEAESQGPGLEGWWFGNGVYDFLADYCVWATREFGGMNLWSVKHERLARPGQPLPNPCLPPRDEAPRP